MNIFGLLISTQGFISPVLASVIHEGNALVVVFNSLRPAKAIIEVACNAKHLAIWESHRSGSVFPGLLGKKANMVTVACEM